MIDALETVAAEARKSVPQVAINWLLRRPTVASVIVGARDETQLRDNRGGAGKDDAWQYLSTGEIHAYRDALGPRASA